MEILSSLVGQNIPVFWADSFFYLFSITLIAGLIGIRYLIKKVTFKNNEYKQTQQLHIAKIDLIRKDHGDKVEDLQTQMLQKEEDRTRQWIESEKETLHVLNGVSSLLELKENISRIDSQKIISKLEEIKSIVDKKRNDE